MRDGVRHGHVARLLRGHLANLRHDRHLLGREHGLGRAGVGRGGVGRQGHLLVGRVAEGARQQKLEAEKGKRLGKHGC